MIDENAWNFDAMKEAVGVDPFAETANKYARDERFYTLSKDKDGNGAALIRFLPDSEKGIIQKLFKINTTVTKNGKKRFISEFSPSTIGQPDPFQEEWQRLWNEGEKEGAKTYGRGIRYVANIKILKDPATPENEGKIFMYEMSGAMKDKIQNAVDPSAQDRDLGASPKELFNPLKGNSFRLVAKRGANGQINYDSSDVISDVTAIYENVDTAIEDIKANTYVLSDLIKPESFMSYTDLQAKMKWVLFEDAPGAVVTVPITTTVAEVPKVQPEVNEGSGKVQTPQSTPVDTPVEPPAETPVDTPAAQAVAAAQSSQADSLDSLLEGLI